MSLLRDWPTGLALVLASCAIMLIGVPHEAKRFWAGLTLAQMVDAESGTLE